MTVTELAILPLTAQHAASLPTLSPSLINKLILARRVLISASRYHFSYFYQVEDPSILYLVGAWDSAPAHHAFIASQENQELLELLKDEIALSDTQEKAGMKMWHLEGNIFNNSELTASENGQGKNDVLKAPVISINRHFIPPSKKESFLAAYSRVKHLLEEYTYPYQVAGGWRIEKEEVEGKKREEFCLFSGFGSVEHHQGFAKIQAFQEYRTIVGEVEGFEVRHLKVMDLGEQGS